MILSNSKMNFTEPSSFKRLFAFIIDLLLCVCLYLVMCYIFILLGNSNWVNFLLESVWGFLLSLLLILLLLTFKDLFFKRSPGKWLMGLKIVDRNTLAGVENNRLILRNLGTLVWPIELVFWIGNSRHLKIGDISTQCVVVETKERALVGGVGFLLIVVFSAFLISLCYQGALTHSRAYETALQGMLNDAQLYKYTSSIKNNITFKKGRIYFRENHLEAKFTFVSTQKDNPVLIEVYLFQDQDKVWHLIDILVETR